MSYFALYRKYRPDTFEEVKGQDHVVTTLRNQVIADRVGHAYLFCGTRGTGKTSVAKILARAVNCEHPVNGSPCGECASCREIAAGTSMNVIEIDAASNNGVDNIRGIREEVAYSPTRGRYKVYIIDEAHMLTAGAFNALLKTLEEPPSYVIFILATTEAHKIPVTIMSRCQRYDFHRIGRDVISARLRELLDREGVGADEKAISYIARKADGGMRDALSLTDQCISFYLGQELTYEKVLDILGAVDMEAYSKLFDAVRVQDTAAAITMLDEMIYQGGDLVQLAADLTEYVRDVMLLRASGGNERILDVSADNMKLLKEAAEHSEDAMLLRYIRILSAASEQMKNSSSRRVVLEVALIRMCRPDMETDTDSLAERIRVLEHKIEQGWSGPAPAAATAGSGPAGAGMDAAAQASAAPQPPRDYDKPAPEDLQRIQAQWPGIVDGVKMPLLRMELETAKLCFRTDGSEDDRIYVVLTHVMAKDIVEHDAEPTRQLLEQLIEQQTGRHIRVKLIDGFSGQGPADASIREIEVDKRLSTLGVNVDHVD